MKYDRIGVPKRSIRVNRKQTIYKLAMRTLIDNLTSVKYKLKRALSIVHVSLSLCISLCLQANNFNTTVKLSVSLIGQF